MATAEIVQKCRKTLAEYYGAQFKGLILYGSVARDQASPGLCRARPCTQRRRSVARDQASPGSDIDLLVLLSRPFDYFVELREIIELLYPIQLESDRLISAKPASLDEFERGVIQLYRSAKREGVAV